MWVRIFTGLVGITSQQMTPLKIIRLPGRRGKIPAGTASSLPESWFFHSVRICWIFKYFPLCDFLDPGICFSFWQLSPGSWVNDSSQTITLTVNQNVMFPRFSHASWVYFPSITKEAQSAGRTMIKDNYQKYLLHSAKECLSSPAEGAWPSLPPVPLLLLREIGAPGCISPRLLTTAPTATRLKTGTSSRFSITQHTRIIYFKWQWIFFLFWVVNTSAYFLLYMGFLCNFWSALLSKIISLPPTSLNRNKKSYFWVTLPSAQSSS